MRGTASPGRRWGAAAGKGRWFPHPRPGPSERLRDCARPRRGAPSPGTAPAPSPRDTQEPITGPRGRAAGRSCLRGRGAHARRRRGRAGRGRARGSRRRPGVRIAPPASLAPPRRGQRGRGRAPAAAHLWPRGGAVLSAEAELRWDPGPPAAAGRGVKGRDGRRGRGGSSVRPAGRSAGPAVNRFAGKKQRRSHALPRAPARGGTATFARQPLTGGRWARPGL